MIHPDDPAQSYPEFLNGAVLLRTELAPGAILAGLHRIEARLGRDRSRETARWRPRLIDLDLIALEDLVVDERGAAPAAPRDAQARLRAGAALRGLARLAPPGARPDRGGAAGRAARRLSVGARAPAAAAASARRRPGTAPPSATWWVRISAAPFCTATRLVSCESGSRSASGTPKKPLREMPTTTGIGASRATSSSNRASSSQLWAGLEAQELAPARVEHELVGVDAGGQRHVDPRRQPVADLAHHVAVADRPVGRVRQRPVLGVHHHQHRPAGRGPPPPSPGRRAGPRRR